MNCPHYIKSINSDALMNQNDGRRYWEGVNADVDGMLGGFPHVSRADLQGSRGFLAKLGIGSRGGRRKVARALDGGAGIGRITEGLLLDVAGQVDVVEPVARFTAALEGKAGVRRIFNVGLEDWRPEDGVQYDVIWTQWCVGHLTDAQMVAYLERCKRALNPDGGVIVVKENLSTGGSDLFDDVDSSVTREDGKFRVLFEQAGLRIVKMELQKGFPKVLFPVKMYALKVKVQEN